MRKRSIDSSFSSENSEKIQIDAEVRKLERKATGVPGPIWCERAPAVARAKSQIDLQGSGFGVDPRERKHSFQQRLWRGKVAIRLPTLGRRRICFLTEDVPISLDCQEHVARPESHCQRRYRTRDGSRRMLLRCL